MDDTANEVIITPQEAKELAAYIETLPGGICIVTSRQGDNESIKLVSMDEGRRLAAAEAAKN